MYQNSIIYQFENDKQIGIIAFEGQKVKIQNLKKNLAQKFKIQYQIINLQNMITGQKYQDQTHLNSGSKILIKLKQPQEQIIIQNQVIVGSPQNIISNIKFDKFQVRKQVEKLASIARFFLIKNFNSENLRKAKQISLWASTINTQKKLKQVFQQSDRVLLFFKQNISNDLVGLAEMKSIPEDVPMRHIWQKSQQLKLGGNFKINWISKSRALGRKYSNEINPLTKENILKCPDFQEIQKQLGKKLVFLFEFNQETYYNIIKDKTKSQKQIASQNIFNNLKFIPPPPEKKKQQKVKLPQQLFDVMKQMNQIYYTNFILDKQKAEIQKWKSIRNAEKEALETIQLIKKSEQKIPQEVFKEQSQQKKDNRIKIRSRFPYPKYHNPNFINYRNYFRYNQNRYPYRNYKQNFYFNRKNHQRPTQNNKNQIIHQNNQANIQNDQQLNIQNDNIQQHPQVYIQNNHEIMNQIDYEINIQNKEGNIGQNNDQNNIQNEEVNMNQNDQVNIIKQ